MNTIRLWLTIAMVLAITGCATPGPAGGSPPESGPGVSVEPAQGTGWWFARFYIDRPEGEAPRWYIGTLIGGEVIAPVFDAHFQDILIWRVHRRAGNDPTGHKFSFIFYSSAEGARRIYAALDKNPVLQQLKQAGRVTRVVFDDTSQIKRPRIEDTSDPHWSLAVQRTWPALAMGASRMWLDLVGETAASRSDEPDLEQRYIATQQDVTSIWATQGQHAVLHHISGIFAYQPLLITY